MNKTQIILTLCLIAIAGCTNTVSTEITSFQECKEAGYDIMESHPRQCAANGQVFVEELATQECDAEHETYCPSLGECVSVWSTYCEEFSEYYQEPQACTLEYAPVCAELTVPTQDSEKIINHTFGNACAANAAGANIISQGECKDQIEDKFIACEAQGGTAVPEFNECEYISQDLCSELGGEFYECESACRNDPNYPDVICTKQCVILCKFN